MNRFAFFRPVPIDENYILSVVVWLVGMLLQAIAVLIPLAILIALIIVLWRSRPMRALRRWVKGPEEAEA